MPTTVRPIALLAGALLSALLLGGCMSVPVLSEPPSQRGPQKTLAELREQALDLVVTTQEGTGLPDGWYLGSKADGGGTLWTPEVIIRSPPEICGMGRQSPAPLRLQMSISHDPGVDPKVLADRVTPVWQKNGFTVSTVTPYQTFPDGTHDIEIRGDRADGAMVDLFASDEIVSIDIQTTCSTHETVLDEYRRTIEATIPTLPPTPTP